MSTYQCEGFIKEVKVANEGVTFTLEPSAPYLFEKKAEDGKTERCLLLVNDSKTSTEAMIHNGDIEFSAPSKCDLSAMLIAKANRLKVRMTVESAKLVNVTAFAVL